MGFGGRAVHMGPRRQRQLGHGAFADEPTPRAVAALSSVRAAAACFGGMEMAETHTGFLLVRTAKGALYSCGCSERGALGRPPLPGGDTGDARPVDFPSELTVVVAMAAADNHAAAVAQDSSLYTWGNADHGSSRRRSHRRRAHADARGQRRRPRRPDRGPRGHRRGVLGVFDRRPLLGEMDRSGASAARPPRSPTSPPPRSRRTGRRGGAPSPPSKRSARPVPLAEGLVARAVVGGGYHHARSAGRPTPACPREGAPRGAAGTLRGAVGAELAGMLLDDCRGSAPTQLRHELRLLRQFLAAEADKLAALKELRRKAPSGDAWTEGQVTVRACTSGRTRGST